MFLSMNTDVDLCFFGDGVGVKVYLVYQERGSIDR